MVGSEAPLRRGVQPGCFWLYPACPKNAEARTPVALALSGLHLLARLKIGRVPEAA